MTVSRTLSGTERLWLVADRMHPPFVNQLVIELDGALPPEPALRRAMEVAAAAHPGARARVRGALWGRRWEVVGEAPPVRTVDGSAWSGHDPDHAGFLLDPLPPEHGPTVELLRVEGPLPRLVLRSHHALMDGGGTTLFALDLARSMRGEPLTGSELASTRDVDLARAAGARRFQPRPLTAGAPTGPPSGPPGPTTWRRVRHAGPTRALLPRLAVALHEASRTFTDAPLVVQVPVDLRRHAPGLRSTANLTGLVYLDVDAALREPSPVAALRDALDRLAAGPEAGEDLLGAELLRWIPEAWLAALGRRNLLREARAGRYPHAAVISNLGRMDLDALRMPGMQPRRAFWIPPAGPGQRLFLTMTGGPDGVELCAAMADAYADAGRLDALLTGILRSLQQGPA